MFGDYCGCGVVLGPLESECPDCMQRAKLRPNKCTIDNQSCERYKLYLQDIGKDICKECEKAKKFEGIHISK